MVWHVEHAFVCIEALAQLWLKSHTHSAFSLSVSYWQTGSHHRAPACQPSGRQVWQWFNISSLHHFDTLLLPLICILPPFPRVATFTRSLHPLAPSWPSSCQSSFPPHECISRCKASLAWAVLRIWPQTHPLISCSNDELTVTQMLRHSKKNHAGRREMVQLGSSRVAKTFDLGRWWLSFWPASISDTHWRLCYMT